MFTRDGADLSREVRLTLGEALLGAEVPVETITGKLLLLRVPAGTQPGRTFRLAGQGLPRFRGEGHGRPPGQGARGPAEPPRRAGSRARHGASSTTSTHPTRGSLGWTPRQGPAAGATT